MNARKRNGRGLMLAALLSVAGAAFLTGCGGDDDSEKPPPAPPPVPAQGGHGHPL